MHLRFTLREVSKYRVFSGPYFPVLRLNRKIYGVNLRIQSEYRQIGTRKNSYLDTFYAVLNTDYKTNLNKVFVLIQLNRDLEYTCEL